MTQMRGAINRVDTRSGRFYVWQREKYWSVTTILDSLPKHHVLVNWAKKMVATAAVVDLDLLAMMRANHRPEAIIDWLKRAPDRARDEAADLGSSVHEAAEAHVMGNPYPEWTDAQRPFMENAFLPWIETWDPSFLAIEAPVFSKTHRYAGTLDAVVIVDGIRLLVDYKTTRSGVYPETALQLTAYRHAETFIGLPDGDEDPMQEVDGVATVHLRPEGFQFIPMRSDREMFDVFLYVREVFRWEQETKRGAMGAAANPNFRFCLRVGCGHHALLHVARGCTEANCKCPGMRLTPLKQEAV